MGNSGSHLTLTTAGGLKQEPWAEETVKEQHSLGRLQQYKVLPEKGLPMKLKHTDNGEILFSGGTLTGRQKAIVDKNTSDGIPSRRPYLPKGNLSRTRSHGVQHKLNQNASQKAVQEQMKTFTSEPDLRLVSPTKHTKEKRSKKKYKAPSPPQQFQSMQKSEWEDSFSDNELPMRRARLFKTRAESKQGVNHINEPSEPKLKVIPPRSNRTSLPEMKFAGAEEFQRELREATKRLCRVQQNEPQTVKISGEVREEPSGKESSSPEPSPKLPPKEQKMDQSKFFYFGMENHATTDITTNHPPKIVSTDSDISTDLDSDEASSKVKINLQLRPILPKKQLEIPRFSPADAWRLLSTIETNTEVTVASDDVSVFAEESIEQCSRPAREPTFIQVAPRFSNDKSGDSGISGDDAIPITGFDEQHYQHSSDHGMQAAYSRAERISWTPQQDLDDESSADECINGKIVLQRATAGAHIFSLSLPRDNMMDKAQFNCGGLEKLKRSFSGVLSHLSSKKETVQSDEDNVNWFLSKSTLNSLSNGFHSLEMNKSDMDHGKSSRLMYLPEINNSNRYPVVNRTTMKKSLQDTKKAKKFTFQSTIRQIEKRTLSEKLSREAEKREQMRLREVEAMQRVEQEFQKKRDKEKANIKRQLSLYRKEEHSQWSSLPADLYVKSKERTGPEGATSSPSPSITRTVNRLLDNFDGPKTTQTKSVEGKVMDYKRTRHTQQTAVYPDMEKVNGILYKRMLTIGGQSTISLSSSYSDDSHHYGKHAPVTRF